MKYFARTAINAFVQYAILQCQLSVSTDDNNKFINNKHCAKNFISSNAFTECFLQSDNSIVMIGNFNDPLYDDFPFKSQNLTIRLLGMDNIASIKILSETKIYKMKNSVFENLLLPANNFFLSNLSVASVKIVLTSIKYSVLWNLYARYIIDETGNRHSCGIVSDYFMVLWEYQIHNTIFMCRDVDEEIYFFNFNPFSEKVPNGWMEHQKILQENGHPLTIYKRVYNRFQGSQSLCESNIFFEKTISLGGYPIRIMELYSAVKNLPYELHEYGIQVSGTIVDTIWYSLNATLLKFYFPSSRRGSIDKAGHPLGLLKELLEGHFDMQLNLDYERDFWRNQVYTYLESGICYLARKDRHNDVKKISSLFSVEIWLLLISIALTLILVFQQMLKVSHTQVAINLLRGVLGVSMFYEPKRPLDRIVFYVFIYTFIVLNSCFQSRLLSLLAAPVLKETIQVPYDLITYRYRVYAEQRYEQFLYDSKFQYYTRRVENVRFCLDKMRYSKKTSCILDCWAGKVLVYGKEFIQLVEDEELPKYFVHIFRDNFCLIRIYKRRYARLFQSGIVSYLQKSKIRVHKSNYELKQDEGTNGIKLSQIEFAFYFLLYSLLGAVLTFLTELAISLISAMKIRGMMRKILNKLFVGIKKTFSILMRISLVILLFWLE